MSSAGPWVRSGQVRVLVTPDIYTIILSAIDRPGHQFFCQVTVLFKVILLVQFDCLCDCIITLSIILCQMFLDESSGDNETYCNETYSLTQKNTLLIVLGSTGLVSFSSCVVAVSLVFLLGLHKKSTYRLAMYQVLSALAISFNLMLSFVSLNHSSDSLPFAIYCKAKAFFAVYFHWVNLLFTISLTFHLFYLAVFLKNLEKMELFYVLFSTLFPLLFSWIPFIHNNYGVAGAWCWIRDWKDDCATQNYLEGIIEQFTLWYGPLFVCLTISIIATIIIVLVLLWRVCKAKSDVNQPLLKSKYKKALHELLPLLAYPAIFDFLFLFPLVNRIYDAVTPFTSFKLSLAHSITVSLLGLFSSTVLILHVVIVRFHRQVSSVKRDQWTWDDIQGGIATSVRGTHAATTNYSTVFLSPGESEVDRKYESS